MSAPQPAPMFYVVPATAPSGLAIILYKSDILLNAEIEALRLTALNDQQYLILKTISYTERYSDLAAEQVESLIYNYPS